MQKEIRKQQILKRKNFLPSLIITLLLLATLILILYFTDPKLPIYIVLFLINIFLFLFFMSSILFASSRRGLIIASCTVLFLVCRLFGIGNILNLILIVGLGIIFEIYANFKK